jgi:hypothetical protein
MCDICRVDSSWERSFLRHPNDKIMTIIEWKQHHAFGMMTEMPNDNNNNNKMYWIMLQNNWTHKIYFYLFMQPRIDMVYIGLKAKRWNIVYKLTDGLDVSNVLILNVNFCFAINQNGLGWTDSKKTEPCHFESKPNRIEPTPNRPSPNH